MEEVQKVKDSIETRLFNNPMGQLTNRSWLIHWSHLVVVSGQNTELVKQFSGIPVAAAAVLEPSVVVESYSTTRSRVRRLPNCCRMRRLWATCGATRPPTCGAYPMWRRQPCRCQWTEHGTGKAVQRHSRSCRSCNQEQSEKITELLQDEEVVGNLRSDKAANLRFLEEEHGTGKAVQRHSRSCRSCTGTVRSRGES
jgi:hypothetical protein